MEEALLEVRGKYLDVILIKKILIVLVEYTIYSNNLFIKKK